MALRLAPVIALESVEVRECDSAYQVFPNSESSGRVRQFATLYAQKPISDELGDQAKLAQGEGIVESLQELIDLVVGDDE